MSGNESQKNKLLLVARLLWERSDGQHQLSAGELIRLLEQQGISAERKSIYRDIAALRQAGMDIACGRGEGSGYYLASRTFEPAELKLLVDAVQASASISVSRSRSLIKKLQGLTSIYQAKELNRQVYVSGRAKTENEALIYNVDALHEAINSAKKISFRYYEYAPDKKLRPRRGGEIYTVSPYMLCWDDEKYYLVAYHERYGGLSHFRVDKMKYITILDEGVVRCDVDIAGYAAKTFGMFAGRTERVEMEIPDKQIGVVIDRFGKNVFTSPAGEGRIAVSFDAAVSPAFFSWVFMLKDSVITHPENVRRQYAELLEHAAEMYSGSDNSGNIADKADKPEVNG